MWAWTKKDSANQQEISFFDVKELYERAYTEKAKCRVNFIKYRALMAKAERYDALYRAQLANKSPFTVTKAVAA